jgi:hypothetical protein
MYGDYVPLHLPSLTSFTLFKPEGCSFHLTPLDILQVLIIQRDQTTNLQGIAIDSD